jgi:hypothetical protein
VSGRAFTVGYEENPEEADNVRAVFLMVEDGYTTRQIAAELGVPERTVTHPQPRGVHGHRRAASHHPAPRLDGGEARA